jgi:hypothetical protein
MCLEVLENYVTDNLSLNTLASEYFQQDGASLHYSLHMRIIWMPFLAAKVTRPYPHAISDYGIW